jgi:hypothetical protein
MKTAPASPFALFLIVGDHAVKSPGTSWAGISSLINKTTQILISIQCENQHVPTA